MGDEEVERRVKCGLYTCMNMIRGGDYSETAEDVEYASTLVRLGEGVMDETHVTHVRCVRLGNMSIPGKKRGVGRQGRGKRTSVSSFHVGWVV